MKGIECAFAGILGRDAQVRTSAAGREWLSLSIIVGEEPDEQWLSVASFSASTAEFAPQLTKGVQIYVEGKLKLRSWDGADGVTRWGLSVSASLVQPLALIGQRRPKKTRATSKAKVDPQAPLSFADGRSIGQGDALPF